MNHTPPIDGDDATLRARLRGGLVDTARGGDSEALQARVLAQWQQRHPMAEATFAQAGGAALRGGGTHRGRRLWWWAGALVAAALLLSVAPSQQRPDPALEELLQLDVLSLISMGEM